jgi:hypothetical protein
VWRGGVVGGLLSSTGIGAAIGVPAIAVSTVVVVGGAANVMAGLTGLMSSAVRPESGSQGPPPAARDGVRTNDPNNLNHIFGDPAHNLGPVVTHFGSQEAAFDALKSATEAALKSKGLAKGTFRTIVE